MIVQELRAIQERCGYLPEGELRALSKRLEVPLHRLHEVASYYPLYKLEQPPKVEVLVCRDMACHLKGSDQLTRALEAEAGDIGVSRCHVKGVSCLGQCDRPVAVSINDYVYFGKGETEIRQIMQQAAAGEKLARQSADRRPLGTNIDIYAGQPAYTAVREYVAKPDADALIKKLEVSGLRGMGGAGFPTFRKWGAVRSTPGDVKYIVCNADESEPGTFKDRELMRRAPWLVIEGMILAAMVTGAQKGYLYIRHEFHEEEHMCEKALKECYRQGLLGKKILGSNFDFDLEMYVSPGGYVQGEESALLEAIEDRRGEPRNKPPFPTTNGLFQKPTVINNVETLSWIPGIVTKGGEWYRDMGVRGATGMRYVSISGDINRPGVYEVPFGQTVRELINDTAGGMSGGQRLKALATSGPSGGFLPAMVKVENIPEKFVKEKIKPGTKTFDLMDLPLDLNTVGSFGGMLGAACVVYGDRANVVEEALNCVAFYRNETCGKCVPCRMGTQKLVDMIQDILARKFPRGNLPAITDLAATMSVASICGLGQVASNPITSVMTHFPEDLERYFSG